MCVCVCVCVCVVCCVHVCVVRLCCVHVCVFTFLAMRLHCNVGALVVLHCFLRVWTVGMHKGRDRGHAGRGQRIPGGGRGGAASSSRASGIARPFIIRVAWSNTHTFLCVLHRLPAASVPGRRRGQRHAHLPLLLLHCLVMDTLHCRQRHQGQLHQRQRQHQDVRHHDSVPKPGGHGDDSVCVCGQRWATSAARAAATSSPTATGESFACASLRCTSPTARSRGVAGVLQESEEAFLCRS